jgi:ring-1,2-phenylacetyl-CoA epoxidase subunit PaaE
VPAPRRLGFNRLHVAQVAPLTDEAVSVRFDLPPELVDAYAHQPGQYLTIRANLQGQRLMRRYSICSPAGSGTLSIGVKRRRDGLFSNHVNDQVRAGDVLDVMTPMGGFTAAVDSEGARHYVGVAVGSGITPLRSIAMTVLAREPRSRVTLVYANRTPRSTMFQADLDDLGRRYPDRFHLIQVFSESGPESAYRGRLDPDLLTRIAAAGGLVSASALWYLSGPYDLVETLKAHLVTAGVDGEAVRTESFFRPDEAPAQPVPLR